MKRKLHSVWFDEAANKVHTSVYYDDYNDTDDDASAPSSSPTWFSFDDLQSFKTASVKRALKIRTEHMVNPRHSYASTLVHVYLACLNGGTPARPLLQKLSQLALAHRRGLEFQSMPQGAVRMERAKQRFQVRRAVVQLMNGSDEEIRYASEELSLSARVFARALGEADAMAAGTVEQSLPKSSSSSWNDLVVAGTDIPEKQVVPLIQTDDTAMTARSDVGAAAPQGEEQGAALPKCHGATDALLQRALVAS